MTQETRVISGVLNFSITQVMIWLSREFKLITGTDLPIKMVGNKTALRQADAALTKANGGEVLKYPFALAVIADMSTDDTKAGFKKNNVNGGYLVGKNVDAGIGYMENLRPVKVGLGFNFRTDNVNDLIKLAHVLLMNVPKVGFVMKGEHGFLIETSITIDPSVSLPETNFDSPGEGFQYEFVLILNTYVGYAFETKLIKHITFNTTDSDKEEEFWAGNPYHDLTKVVTFTDYYDKTSSLYKGYKEEDS